MDLSSRLPDGFWKLNVGHIGLGVVWLATFFISYGSTNEKFNRLLDWKTETALRIETMDKTGTVASRQKLELETMTLNDHAARLIKTEDAIADIKVMKFKLDQVSDDVKKLSQFKQ